MFFRAGHMSTRGGFFRAWAAGTVLWVGIVAFIGIPSVSQSVKSKYIYVPGDPRKFEPYPSPRPGIDDGRIVRLNDGSELYFHRSIRLYQDNDDVDPIINDFWQQRWLRYWVFMQPWLLLAALPGFLFILLYAVLWVVDGFGGAAAS
jgi:hypothetical protein